MAERDNNGQGLLGMPVWARVIALVGGPTAAAGYLIYVMTTSVAADTKAMRFEMEAHATEVRRHVVETREQIDAIKSNLWVICRELSKSDLARSDCKR